MNKEKSREELVREAESNLKTEVQEGVKKRFLTTALTPPPSESNLDVSRRWLQWLLILAVLAVGLWQTHAVFPLVILTAALFSYSLLDRAQLRRDQRHMQKQIEALGQLLQGQND